MLNAVRRRNAFVSQEMVAQLRVAARALRRLLEEATEKAECVSSRLLLQWVHARNLYWEYDMER